MKKTVSVLIVCMLFLGMFSFAAEAYRIGDVVGYALTTDIAAAINGYDIPSYNVEGYTYIVVEDLRYYGFSVNYDDATRTLSVSRDFSQGYVSKFYEKPYVSPGLVGNREHKLLYTDIVTYFDGSSVPAFNINGQTIVRFDILASYGALAYDNNKREISVAIAGLSTNPNPVDREKAKQKGVIGEYAHTQYDNSVTVSEYDGENIAFEILSIGQNGNRIAVTYVREKISGGVCYFNFEDSWYNTGNGVLKILDNGKLSLSFYNENIEGMWSVSFAAGEFTRVGDLPENYEPMF